MPLLRNCLATVTVWKRGFASTSKRLKIRDIAELSDRITPTHQTQEIRNNDLVSLQWPSPPRNILLTKKDNDPAVTESFIEYAKHIHSTYDSVSLVLESHVANALHDVFSVPIYTAPSSDPSQLQRKVDLVSTLGGDGTILHASSLFATARQVPPILSFSMGTLGFLGEWKFREYKRAFREVYMSGAWDSYGSAQEPGKGTAGDSPVTLAATEAATQQVPTGAQANPPNIPSWSSIRGKSMGPHRGARVLLRNRLRVGVFAPDGDGVSGDDSLASARDEVYAMNEVVIHRGRGPHLTIVDIYIGGRFLTEAVADGIIISTPTGSTAYSLSSGGSIVHPLVSSLLLTPICPRSLSFRPLVLPNNTPITLRLSEKNRAKEVEVSVDGVRRSQSVGVGTEVRVSGEEMRDVQGSWVGGVPSIVRSADGYGEDHWVGGLNALLKFNYPFGEEV